MTNKVLVKSTLTTWASAGLLVLLCGPWMLPNTKLYHQLIIFLLWLPAVLALSDQSFRRMLRRPEAFLFAIFAAWTFLVLVVEGSDDPGKSKVVLYVTLTLLGALLAAQQSKWQIESLLFWSSMIGGVFALVSVVYFYGWAPRPSGMRLISVGLWDTAIMAAHAVGALAILGLFTLHGRRVNKWTAAVLVLAAIGYLSFLGLNQTRGVWIALVCTMVIMVVARPTRLGMTFIAMIAIGLAAIALFDAGLLLQRGVSYRPSLWQGGLLLIEQHWMTGLGFHEYLITVPIAGSFKHPHNLFLDTGVRLGLPGLLMFCCLWGVVAWRAWTSRAEPLGRALLALWVFSSVSLMTDGIGLWLKPNADWLITWLPVSLSLVLACRPESGKTPEPLTKA